MDRPKTISRRRFIAQAPVLGVPLVAATHLAASESPKHRGPGDYFRVGCLNVMSYSHLNNLWAPLINPRAGGKDTPYTGMRITHCWEIDQAKAEQFANVYGCEAVKNFDDMLGKVDGIIDGGYYNHPWNHILHEPYLEAGLPNLINRPFTNSLTKASRMVETAQKHGATILVPSAFEHNNAIARAKAWTAGKKVICYNATNSFDDYPTHGIHGVYLVSKSVAEAGNPIVSVAYRTKNWHSPPGIMTFEHVDKDGRQFFGCLHQVSGSWGTVHVHAEGEYGGKEFLIRTGTGQPYDQTVMWAPTIWAYQRMALYGEMPQSFDQILQKNNAFMAGWRSVLENDGLPVRLDKVPVDWQSPVELPNRPGDPTVAMFRKKFGKA